MIESLYGKLVRLIVCRVKLILISLVKSSPLLGHIYVLLHDMLFDII